MNQRPILSAYILKRFNNHVKFTSHNWFKSYTVSTICGFRLKFPFIAAFYHFNYHADLRIRRKLPYNKEVRQFHSLTWT